MEQILLRDTYAEIDLEKIAHNIRVMKDVVGPDVAIAAVAKANGYGHGAVEITPILIENGADLLAVATLSEALELKKAYPKYDVMIMGYTPDHLLKIAFDYGCIITIFSHKQAEILNKLGSTRIHFKIDTGFHRLGLSCDEESVKTVQKITSLKNLKVEGIFSHLALSDKEGDAEQFKRFTNFIKQLEDKNIDIKFRHLCDSIATTRYPEYRLNMVRLGAILYGMSGKGQKLPVKQAFTLKSKLSHITFVKKGKGVSYDYFWKAKKDSIIGTLPIGYADGYPRRLTHNGIVSVHGKHVPIAGVICMDQLMIDLSEVPEAKPGDEVILYGDEAGLPISKIALLCQTNKNEILSRITTRVPRVYI
ncbi:MAG: alanine racemase [Bacteroidota bacterium]